MIFTRMSESSFRLNRRVVPLTGSDSRESLLRWLRRERLTGTKEGCGDGDCGACTVALVERDSDGRAHFRAVNACLLPMGMLAGREVLTVEALAEEGTLHPVQQALVDCAGSQCGYCTPGFAMSLFAGWYAGEFDDHVIEGNLCRCTGYAPIRRPAAQLAAMPRASDRFSALLDAASTAPAGEPPHDTPGCMALSPPPRTAESRGEGGPPFHRPSTLAEAFALKTTHPQAIWFCGGTDLGVALSRGQSVASAFIAVDRLTELHTLDVRADAVRIGAGVPLSRLERELAGVFPALDRMLPWFAARQVKNRATLGGNLGSASPIGDLLPWLLAHGAIIEVAGPRGARELPVDGYFQAYRKTARADDELIVAVRVPRLAGPQAAYKVAKRQTDDISIVAAVYALILGDDGRVERARLAYGGVAAIPLRARRTEDFLLGRALDATTVAQACALLRAEFTPLDDHRASADYRRELCAALFAKFVEEGVT